MKKSLSFICILCILIVVHTFLTSNAGGKMGVASSGCGPCHGSATGGTSISLSIGGSSPTGFTYTPGTKYSILLGVTNATFTNTSTHKVGFDMTFGAGTISGAPAGTMVMGTEIHHTTPPFVNSSGQAVWSFDWTAPAAGTGNVTINVAGNVVNGNGSDGAGDAWNLISETISEASSTSAPQIVSTSATNLTSTTAKLNASVNPRGASTSDTFEYGTSTSYGTKIVCTPNPITGTSAAAVSASLTGLTAGTLYHYRLRARNSVGLTLSSDSTFTTPAVAVPELSGETATNISNTGAKLSATVKANSTSAISVTLEYGKTTSYGTNATLSPATAVGTTPVGVSATLTGLTPNTLYNYRFKAGSTVGSNKTFTTTGAGIAKLESDQILLYPNPVSEKLFIKTSQRMAKVEFISLSGQLASLPLVKSSEGYYVVLKDLSTGHYMVRLSSIDGSTHFAKVELR